MGGGGYGWRCAVAGVAVLVVGGCQGGEAQDEPVAAEVTPLPTPRATPSPTPSPTPGAVDPYTVPDDPADIDEAYVQAVLDELDALDGEMFRIVVREREITEEAEALLNAVYEEPARSEELDLLELELEEGFPDVRPNPGDRETSVQAIISVTDDCVFIAAQQDYSAVSEAWEGWDPTRQLFLGLRHRLGIGEDEFLNPTPWQVFLSRVHSVDEEPPDPCA
jgi:hypothetical protein